VKNLRPVNQAFEIQANGWALPITVDAQGQARREFRASIVAGLNTEIPVKLEPVPKDETQ
jgi:hypothetical protein